MLNGIHRRIDIKVATHLLLFSIVVILLAAVPAAAFDGLIGYQGYLTDNSGQPIADSTYSMAFGIYADSTGGSFVWAEAADVVTIKGRFSHTLGSSVPIPVHLLEQNETLFLEVRVGGEALLPRTRLLASPYAANAGSLTGKDENGTPSIETDIDQHSLTIFDSTGQQSIFLRGTIGDSSVMLPDSAINAKEIKNEAGFTTDFNIYQVTLSDGEMQDLMQIDITIPEDGYILLYGKCYAMLSGTTGPNQVQIQIDFDSAGVALFPYYTQAGLAGYVNTDVNYFPIFVQRAYFAEAGTYAFRMEGRAVNAFPALARTWDHQLTAVYVPTAYWAVYAASPLPFDNPATELKTYQTPDGEVTRSVYKLDLRLLEEQAKEKKLK